MRNSNMPQYNQGKEFVVYWRKHKILVDLFPSTLIFGIVSKTANGRYGANSSFSGRHIVTLDWSWMDAGFTLLQI